MLRLDTANRFVVVRVWSMVRHNSYTLNANSRNVVAMAVTDRINVDTSFVKFVN